MFDFDNLWDDDELDHSAGKKGGNSMFGFEFTDFGDWDLGLDSMFGNEQHKRHHQQHHHAAHHVHAQAQG